MKKADEITVEQAFSLFFRAAAARGVTDKTLATYKHHSRALFKRCDGSVFLKIFHNNFYKNQIKEHLGSNKTTAVSTWETAVFRLVFL